MKLRNTLLLLIVAVGLFAYIQFVEKERPDAKTAMENGEQLTQIDRDKIDTVSIRNAETKIELKKNESGAWLLDEPLKDRANSVAITQLFTAVETLKNTNSIDPADKKADANILKDSGVESANVRVKFTGGGKSTEITLGNDSAIEGKIYARVDGDPKLYVIPSDLKTQITKKAEEFRDKKLMDLTASAVNKLQLKTSAGEIELEKKNDHWTLVKPLATRGDDAKVNDLIANTVNTQIETFIGDSANLATYGLQEPRATLTLFAEGAKEPAVLQLGASPKEERDKDKFYAKLSNRDSVVILPKAIESLLNTKPNDLRDKNLIRIESDIVDRITIEAAGREKLVLARDGEKWVRKADKDTEINAALAQQALEALRNQQVVNFVADVASELPKYGLDAPVLKVTLSSFASENTAESAKGEKPIAAILFGKTEGDNVYAKIDSEPFVVSVAKTIVEQFPTDAIALQPLEIFKNKPEDITSLELTLEGQATLSLEKDKEKGWKLTKGDGAVNPVKTTTLVNTLSTLRAARWAGVEKPEHGFEKPTLTVTFKTAGNTTGKLVFGASHPENLWHAKADGVNGVFLVGLVEAENLRATLIDPPAPAAPAPGAPPSAGAAPMPGEKKPITVTTPPVSVTMPPAKAVPANPEPPKPEPAPAPAKPQPTEATKPAPEPAKPAPEPAKK